MDERTVRTILRLVAVVTILIGAIEVVMSLITYVVASRSIDGAFELGLYAILSQAAIVGEGVLLYLMSPMLAQKIVA